MRIRRLGPGDDALVLAASDLFDEPPAPAWTARFLTSPGHHLFVAYEQDVPAGFITGVEVTHPDKGTEMFLYELGVDEPYQRRGIGTALVETLAALARERGCHGMYVGTEPDNAAAIATYLRAGSGDPEATVTLTWTFSRGPASHR